MTLDLLGLNRGMNVGILKNLDMNVRFTDASERICHHISRCK
jgi:hypothetical protein